jgi:hypothetical protein
MNRESNSLLCVVLLFTFAALRPFASRAENAEASSKVLVLSRAEYLDRVQAIWTAQMIERTYEEKDARAFRANSGSQRIEDLEASADEDARIASVTVCDAVACRTKESPGTC